MLAIIRMDNIDDIFYKISSGFIFGIHYGLEPTTLAAKLISRAYITDKHPGRVEFFDLSHSKIDKHSPLSTIRNITDKWIFGWTNLSPSLFKAKI